MTLRHLLPALVLPAVLTSVAVGPASAADPVGVWPLVPVPTVVERFDPPDQVWGAGHRGVDLQGTIGQPVRTALPGTVSYAGDLAGRGVVVVTHGATRTTYQPVLPVVTVGDGVAAGTRIGLLELGGSHCLPAVCLHWGWLRGRTYLDPLRLVGGGPVRLLPLSGEPSVAPLSTPPRLGPWAAWRPLAQALGCACW